MLRSKIQRPRFLSALTMMYLSLFLRLLIKFHCFGLRLEIDLRRYRSRFVRIAVALLDLLSIPDFRSWNSVVVGMPT